GVMTDLGTLGGNYSYAISLNNSNIFVGGSFIDSEDSIYHAFIWDGNSMRDLNLLLDSTSSGWTLTEARAINDFGEIVGTGIYNGVNHAFLLQPQSATVFKITSIEKQGSNVIIRSPTITQATYALEAVLNLTNPAWTTVQAGLVGNGSIMSFTNAMNGSGRFYRVKQVVP